jgi:ATP-dependent RNA circularization protein (DNA/RNA ligase family)
MNSPTCNFCGRELGGGYVVHRVIRGQFQEIDLECGCTEETDALDQDIEELGCALGEDSVSP